MIVNPKLAALTAELNEAWDKILDKYLSELPHHAPFGLEMTTIDGLTARFYEEGIEFYPETKEEENN